MSLADRIVSISNINSHNLIEINPLVVDWLNEHVRYTLIDKKYQLVFIRDIKSHKEDIELPIVNAESYANRKTGCFLYSSYLAFKEFELEILGTGYSGNRNIINKPSRQPGYPLDALT